jgi:quercetin dioxygenase-like cupin family protein
VTQPSDHATPLPQDDPNRDLVMVNSDQETHVHHLGVVGDTYTVLLSGKDTDGHYTLIDMFIPPSGGPPPHRHDFEESFTILEGELDLSFRGEHTTAKPGDTVHVPANAPHGFRNSSDGAVRLLCICSPAGQEEFFELVGQPVASRTEPPSPLDDEAQAAFIAKSMSLAARFKTELLGP